MKNLKDINKFVLVEPSEALSLVEGAFPREVRLEVNAEDTVRLAIRSASNPNLMRFLADVRGRDTVVFTIVEPCELWPTSEGQVWWYTAELESASVVSNAETYTKIATRRSRNPELERIARKMQENSDRRIAALMREMDARFAATKPKEGKPDEPAAVVSGKGIGKPKKKGGDAPDAPVQDDGGDPDGETPAS